MGDSGRVRNIADVRERAKARSAFFNCERGMRERRAEPNKICVHKAGF